MLAARHARQDVTVAVLAVGIGANGAIFAMVDAALFKGFALVHDNDRRIAVTSRP